MSNYKITNLSDGTDTNDAYNFKQLSSFKDKVHASDEKYIKRKLIYCW